MKSSSTQPTLYFGNTPIPSKSAFSVYLALQAILLVYLAAALPVHYDEWYSYRHFSAQSARTIISFYPGSNNHVFYNLVTHFFVWPQSNVAFFMRLPSVLAALATVWYLYKLCQRYTSQLSTWLVVLAYSTGYNVLLYAAEARGYAFINLFTVLLIQQTLLFVESKPTLKNYFQFGLVQALGLYTLPTFVYALVPVYSYLFFYPVVTGHYKRAYTVLVLLGVSTTLSFLLYSPILFLGDAETLLHSNTNEGKFSFSDKGAIDSIIYFLNKMYNEVLSLTHPLYTGMLILVVLVIGFFAKVKQLRFFILAFVFLLCPFFIHLVHHYFAYGRNWFFLCVPAALLLGLPVELIHKLLTTKLTVKKYLHSLPAILLVLLPALAVMRAVQFPSKHKIEFSLDYDIAEFLRSQTTISSIARTDGLFEFYPADVIQATIESKYEKVVVPITVITERPTEDVLIIAAEKLAAQKVDRKNYRLCFYTHNMFFYRKIEEQLH